jgi:malate synthase
MTGSRESILQDTANLLIDARRTGQSLAELPPDNVPADLTEIWYVQGLVAAAFGPVGGYKIGAPSLEATPSFAPMPAAWIAPSGATLSGAQWRYRGIEAEIAFLVGKDLPPRATPYTRDEVSPPWPPAIPPSKCWSPPSLRRVRQLARPADLQTHGGFVYGPAFDDWQPSTFPLNRRALHRRRRPRGAHRLQHLRRPAAPACLSRQRRRRAHRRPQGRAMDHHRKLDGPRTRLPLTRGGCRAFPPLAACNSSSPREFNPRRKELLAARVARQKRLDAGERPDFLPETAHIRDADWTVAPLPADLLDRRVEITGPVDRKMIINALNSGAKVFMADFEDSTTPTWDNLLDGQLNLRDASAAPSPSPIPRPARAYALNDRKSRRALRPPARLAPGRAPRAGRRRADVRQRSSTSASTSSTTRRSCSRAAPARTSTCPRWSHLEARLWNDVFVRARSKLGVPQGSIKATVLIETILAAFEMDEILYELRDHSAGLNCGRWDYIFSFIKKFAGDPSLLLPDRAQVTMTTHFMRSYSKLAIKTCHRRNVRAMGGMSALIPIKSDPVANEKRDRQVRADKEREATDGHDGTWVAHPGLVPIALEVFDRSCRSPTRSKQLPDYTRTAADLLAVPTGTITEAGLRQNVAVGLGYVEAWLRGIGCVPLFNLMEDAATAEISRAQLWQWVHHEAPPWHVPTGAVKSKSRSSPSASSSSSPPKPSQRHPLPPDRPLHRRARPSTRRCRQRHRARPRRSRRPVHKSDIVKGYEYSKGQYVTIEPDELAHLRVPSKHTMEVTQFVDEADLDPEFFEKPYFVVPEDDSQTEAFLTVRKALIDTKKIALSRSPSPAASTSSPSHPPPHPSPPAPTASSPAAMMAYTMRYAAELRDPADYFRDVKKVAINADSLSARQGTHQAQGRQSSTPPKFVDGYEVAVKELVDAKLKHAPIPRDEAPRPAPAARSSTSWTPCANPSVIQSPRPKSLPQNRRARRQESASRKERTHPGQSPPPKSPKSHRTKPRAANPHTSTSPKRKTA